MAARQRAILTRLLPLFLIPMRLPSRVAYRGECGGEDTHSRFGLPPAEREGESPANWENIRRGLTIVLRSVDKNKANRSPARSR